MIRTVPLHARTMALSLSNDAATVKLAQSETVTTEALERALTASQRLRKGAAAMETEIKRQLTSARLAERDAAREHTRAERSNAAIHERRALA